MASPRSAGENGSADGVDAVGDAFRVLAQGLAQGLAQLQEALRLEKQEAERRMQEALRLQQERADTALREMERKLEEKDDAILALQQQHQETQDRLTALEERTTDQEGPGGGRMERLEGRVNDVEASLQSALETFMPRVEALLRQLEEPQSSRASVATAASTSAARAREAPATGGAAAGGGEELPSTTSTPSSSDAGHQGAAADEEDRARQRVELRMREALLRKQRARNPPTDQEEQFFEAAIEGRLYEVRHLLDYGADVKYSNHNGSTPLINAASNAHANVVSLLLQRGADANAVDCDGSSALHWAAWKDRSGRCVELLQRAGADVDARSKDGEAPLHWASFDDNEEAVRALLAAGTRRDLKPWGGVFKDKTPFDVATCPQVRNILRC